jgi:predicted metal-binding membrane protein
MPGMMSMDGPGPVASFLWLWLAMSAAMMLPSIVPAARLAAGIGRSGTAFSVGYFTAWGAAGIVAFLVAGLLMGAGRWIAVGACLAAAIYQVTPLKDACLRRCRAPLGLLMRRRAFSAGLEHGAVCLGCCWALMLVLLAVGAGSLLWMAAVAVAIIAEKVAPAGARASAPIALALLGAALWIAL